MAIDLVSINGEFFKPEEAKISVFDRGFLFGDAVYEVTRSYGKILFQLEPHVDRLFNSAELIGLDLGRTKAETIDELYRIYKKVGKPDRYLRVQVTRGEGPIGMSAKLAERPNWVVYVKDLDLVAPENYRTGVPIVTTDRLRNTKKALDPNIKSGNYLNNVLAFREATRQNAFEVVMVDGRGFLTEGTTSNVFAVKDGVVLTPPSSADILRGITRQCLFDLAQGEGIRIEERDLTPADLRGANEVFLTSSTREVLPVSAVDGKAIKSVGGGLTQRLGLAYKKLIEEYCQKAKVSHPWQ